MLQVRDVGLLPWLPGGLGQGVGVRAPDDDGRDAIAEAISDGRRLMRSLVLNRVMEQGCDRLFLVATMLEHQTGDAKQM